MIPLFIGLMACVVAVVLLLTLSSASEIRNLIESGPQTREALARALGMTLTSSRSPSVLLFDGEVAGERALLCINAMSWGETNVSSWRISSVTLELFASSTGAFTFTSMVNESTDETSARSSIPEITREHVFHGSEEDALVFFDTEVRDAMNGLWAHDSSPQYHSDKVPLVWNDVRIDESIQVHCVSIPSPHMMFQLVRDWPELLARVEALVHALSGHTYMPASLLERLMDDDETLEIRVHAALMLLFEHPESEATQQMRAMGELLPARVGVLCAMSPFPEGTTYAPLKRLLSSDFSGLEFGEWLGQRFPHDAPVGSKDPVSARAEVFDALPETMKMQLAVHDHDTLFVMDATVRLALVRGAYQSGVGELSWAAAEVLFDAFPWAMCTDASIPLPMRCRAAESALRSNDAPEDADARDAAFAPLFIANTFANHLTLHGSLVEAGWNPSPDTLAVIVPRVHHDLFMRIVASLEARAITREDGPLLAAIEARTSADFVRALVAASPSDDRLADGRLSLAGFDETRGGLSQSTGRGGLTQADDDT